jgi:uncharacterized protein (TIGR03000 family)
MLWRRGFQGLCLVGTAVILATFASAAQAGPHTRFGSSGCYSGYCGASRGYYGVGHRGYCAPSFGYGHHGFGYCSPGYWGGYPAYYGFGGYVGSYIGYGDMAPQNIINNYYNAPPPPPPDTRDDRMFPPGAVPSMNAQIDITASAGTEVSVDGVLVEGGGATRSYVSPPLVPGQSYSYEVRVVWPKRGPDAAVTQRIAVVAGDHKSVTFLAPPPADDTAARTNR